MESIYLHLCALLLRKTRAGEVKKWWRGRKKKMSEEWHQMVSPPFAFEQTSAKPVSSRFYLACMRYGKERIPDVHLLISFSVSCTSNSPWYSSTKCGHILQKDVSLNIQPLSPLNNFDSATGKWKPWSRLTVPFVIFLPTHRFWAFTLQTFIPPSDFTQSTSYRPHTATRIDR